MYRNSIKITDLGEVQSELSKTAYFNEDMLVGLLNRGKLLLRLKLGSEYAFLRCVIFVGLTRVNLRMKIGTSSGSLANFGANKQAEPQNTGNQITTVLHTETEGVLQVIQVFKILSDLKHFIPISINKGTSEKTSQRSFQGHCFINNDVLNLSNLS